MVLTIILLSIAAALASGILYQHRSVLTYLGLAGVLWQMTWLFLTLLSRTIFLKLPTEYVFLGGSVCIVLVVLFGFRQKKIQFPLERKYYDSKLDLSVLILLGVVLGSAYVITSRNGFMENEWVTHGFYNGDTATFLALVHRSFATKGLVHDNPFAGGSTLEYPTLLHGSVASFFQSLGIEPPVLRFLPSMTLAVIVFTIPMFFLLWDVQGRHGGLALGTTVIAYVLLLSWDGYIYPQSHFFLTGLFLLEAFLFHEAYQKRDWSLIYELLGFTTAIVLLLSNAVTGTAGLAVAGVYTAFAFLGGRRSRSPLITAFGLAILFGLFLFATPGNASLGGFRLPYTAANEILRFTPIIGLLLAGVFLERERNAFLKWSVLTVAALTFIVFFFSHRNIVNENASRFLYHAVLIGFPLVIYPLQKIYTWVRREVVRAHTFMERRAAGLGIVMGLIILGLPPLASVGSAFDNLLRKDTQVISTPLRSALWWIDDNTAPDAIFLASLDAPFAVPLVTGRSLLRTNYWLSPDDIVLADANAAFQGNRAAQEHVLPLVDYILLDERERVLFEPLPVDQFVPVYHTTTYVIYKNTVRVP